MDRGTKIRWAIAALVVAAAWAAWSQLRQEPFARAEGLYARGEYVSAFALYLDLARAGDPRAQFAIARFYEQGLGQNIYDMRSALAWLEEAAAGGYAPAQFRLGLFYYEGEEVAEDLEKAELWWGRAADRNLFGAWARLVRLYPLREGAATLDKKLWHMDENVARLRALSDRGETFATVLLANFHILGAGVEEDYAAAERLLRPAAAAGNANAQYSLGRLLLATGGEAEEALGHLVGAAEQGQVMAQLSLGEIFAAGAAGEADPEQALYWTLVALQSAADAAAVPRGLVGERSRGLDRAAVEAVRERARGFRARNQPARTLAAGDLWN